jgi:uncharacterized protein YkwD
MARYATAWRSFEPVKWVVGSNSTGGLQVMIAQVGVKANASYQRTSILFRCVSLMVVVAVLMTLVAVRGAQTSEALDISPVIATLIDAHNRVRQEHGLPPLQPQPQLMAAAREHARYMAESETTAHRGRGGSMPAQRVQQQGYTYITVAENVASGQSTSEKVLDAWMHSPPHRHNILGDFAEIGAARVIGGDQRPYWCVVFGTPMPNLDPQQATQTLVMLLNQKRAEADLAPLQAVSQLSMVAETQARDMAAHDALQPQTGSQLGEQLAQVGYPYQQVSQAVASGSPTPEAVVAYLMESAPYRDRVLGAYTDVGVGYATADSGTPYWNIIFAVPRG